MKRPVIILGGGGHAKVLIEILINQKLKVLGIVDPNNALTEHRIYGIPIIGKDDSFISTYSPQNIQLVNAIGSIYSTEKRKEVYQAYKEKGYSFATVVHHSAIISETAYLDEGVQIMAGAVIQAGTIIGKNSIINTHSSVDHDSRIGDHVHIAPGVTLSGGVKIGEGTHVGTGVTVIQNISIGKNCLIGAGALVITNIPDSSRAIGIPAKAEEK